MCTFVYEFHSLGSARQGLYLHTARLLTPACCTGWREGQHRQYWRYSIWQYRHRISVRPDACCNACLRDVYSSLWDELCRSGPRKDLSAGETSVSPANMQLGAGKSQLACSAVCKPKGHVCLRLVVRAAVVPFGVLSCLPQSAWLSAGLKRCSHDLVRAAPHVQQGLMACRQHVHVHAAASAAVASCHDTLWQHI